MDYHISFEFLVEDGVLQCWEDVPNETGVYQMHNERNVVLYVGKANSLYKRLRSHFDNPNKNTKQLKMLLTTRCVKVTLVGSEHEALLLENKLIKHHQPAFNVLLKDGKSYPEIFISTKHLHAGMFVHRGAHKKQGEYFGPFVDSHALRSNMQTLSKIFQVRTCQDSVYSARKRPCLQYQIGCCSAPCVGKIGDEAYALDVLGLKNFLLGRVDDVTKMLTEKMHTYSKDLLFEKAARMRDQVSRIRTLQKKQFVLGFKTAMDYFVLQEQDGFYLIRCIMIRSGYFFGQEDFYFSDQGRWEHWLEEFFTRFYWQRDFPDHVAFDDKKWFEYCVALKDIGVAKKTVSPTLVVSDSWLDSAMIEQLSCDVRVAFKKVFFKKMNFNQSLRDWCLLFRVDVIPQRIECVDISHFQGESTVGALVVFEGFKMNKSQYRLYHFEPTHLNDDYAAMRILLNRRFSRKNKRPDVLLMDGGLGQVNVAQSVLDSQGIDALVIGISKGVGRTRDAERLICSKKNINIKGLDHPSVLYLLQYIRDEAHRFAIQNNRKNMLKKRSFLKTIPIDGVGKKRLDQLLDYFGGLSNLKQAKLDEIKRVKGVGGKMAIKIYEYFHTQ